MQQSTVSNKKHKVFIDFVVVVVVVAAAVVVIAAAANIHVPVFITTTISVASKTF